MHGEQIRQAMQDIVRVQLSRNDDRQALARILIDNSQHPEGPPVLCAILHEVIGPDMPGPLGPKTDAGSVIQPEPPALWLFLWYFQPLAPPDAVNPFQIYFPAFRAQKSTHPPIAVAAIGGGKADDRLRQRILIIANNRLPALRCARLTNNAAGTAFRNPGPGAHMLNAIATARRAQYFPSRASLRISLSSVNSETALRRPSFSFSRSFRRLA